MRRLALISLAALSLSSCVFSNDLDYPLLFGGFAAFEAEKQVSCDIDPSSRTVTVALDEVADISAVKVKSYTLTEGARLEEPLPETLDLTSPVDVMVKTWQDYPWKITATQDIERYVHCSGQVGEATFNPALRSVIVKVSEDQSLSALRIDGMKLGPRGSEIVSTSAYEADGSGTSLVTRDCSFPMTLDCVLDRTFTVEFEGKKTDWTFKAVQVAIEVQVQSVVPWCRSAEIKALFSGKGTPSLQIRPSGGEWTEVSGATVSGVGISATVKGLTPGTAYECRVVENGNESAAVSFVTDRDLQLANMGFDDWSLKGKTWNPWAENASGDALVWDTANSATSTFIGSISRPEEDFVAVSGAGKKAARLESTFAVVKFAAGNLFTGRFVGLVQLGAELAWGIPFDSKPKALHGYYCYKPSKIDYADAEREDLKGKNDIGQIQVILTDWAEQFHVISTTGQYVDTKRDPAIIAYASLEFDEMNDSYVEFTLPLEYRDIRTPRYIVIVAASSRWGDFFTGGMGSTLYLDEFELVYE